MRARCPAQVVRLAVLLNGANSRVLGASASMMAAPSRSWPDGGLLNTPVNVDRIALSNGERAEVLMDLMGPEGDNLLMLSFRHRTADRSWKQ